METQRAAFLRTMPYEEYLKTPEWEEKRLAVLARDDHRCRNCNGQDTLNVHHRTYARRGNEDPNDLTTLCERCHKQFHQEVIGRDDLLARTSPTSWNGAVKSTNNTIHWESYLLGMVLSFPMIIPHICVILQEEDFQQEENRTLYHTLNAVFQRCSLPIENIQEDLLPSILAGAIENAKEWYCNISSQKSEEMLIKEAVQCAVRIRRARLLVENVALSTCIREAEVSSHRAEVRALQIQQLDVCQQLRTLGSAMHLHG
jgi:hypothetical protein